MYLTPHIFSTLRWKLSPRSPNPPIVLDKNNPIGIELRKCFYLKYMLHLHHSPDNLLVLSLQPLLSSLLEDRGRTSVRFGISPSKSWVRRCSQICVILIPNQINESKIVYTFKIKIIYKSSKATSFLMYTFWLNSMQPKTKDVIRNYCIVVGLIHDGVNLWFTNSKEIGVLPQTQIF